MTPLLQLLMTGEPSLVAGAAALLESALRYNGDAMPRLYLTGAFFMALAYCGSNLVDIAQLFRVRPPRLIRARQLACGSSCGPLSPTSERAVNVSPSPKMSLSHAARRTGVPCVTTMHLVYRA